MEMHCQCTSVVHQFDHIWRTENDVNIWNLLWLSRGLIICTEQTSIHISTSPNVVTSKKAKNHDTGIYFSTNPIVALCHAPPEL